MVAFAVILGYDLFHAEIWCYAVFTGWCPGVIGH